MTLLLAGREDPVADAHALLATLAAEHARAVLDDIGADRLRAAALRLAVAMT